MSPAHRAPPTTPRSVVPGEHGARIMPDLFLVSWNGMSPVGIDCHVYAVRGPKGVVLIDAGTVWGQARLLRNLAHWGVALDEVRTVLFTHGHVDHTCGGYLFKQRGCELLGHREILVLVENQWEAQGPTGLDPAGQPYRMDGTLTDGDCLRRGGLAIHVLGTPGHTRGCLSYLIEIHGQRCLFSGDLIMSDGLPGWRGDPGHDPAALVASLKRLRRVSFEHLCHGHDAIVHDRGELFRQALRNCAAGSWDRPDSPHRLGQVPGRQPAPLILAESPKENHHA